MMGNGKIEMFSITNMGFRMNLTKNDTTRSTIMYDHYRWSETTPGKTSKPQKLHDVAWQSNDLDLDEGVGVNLGLDYSSGREATSMGVNDGGRYTYVSQNSPKSAFERNIMYTDDTISWLKIKNWNSSSILRIQAIDSTPVKLVRVDTDSKTKLSKANEVIMKFKTIQE